MRSKKDVEYNSAAETALKIYTGTMDKLKTSELSLKAMHEKNSQLEISLAAAQKTIQKFAADLAALNLKNSELTQKNYVDSTAFNQQISEAVQKNCANVQLLEQKFSEASRKNSQEQKVFSGLKVEVLCDRQGGGGGIEVLNIVFLFLLQ